MVSASSVRASLIALAIVGGCSRSEESDATKRRLLAKSVSSELAPQSTSATTSPSVSAPPSTPPSATSPACAHRCDDGDDCPNTPCNCEDGTVVNERYCLNACCAGPDVACPEACKGHDGPKGTWNDARDGKKTGAACMSDPSCATGVCLHGFCSKKCFSFGDCPPFWTCSETAGGTIGKYCQKND